MRPGILFRLQILGLMVAYVGTACPHYAARFGRVCRTAALTLKQDSAAKLPILLDGQHSLKGSESHSYRVTLTAGQYFYALVEQQGIDVEIVLSNPDGSQLAVTDSPNGRWGSEPILIIAATSGEYRVVIRAPSAQAEAGNYRIEIKTLRETTASDKQHVAAQRAFEEAQLLRTCGHGRLLR